MLKRYSEWILVYRFSDYRSLKLFNVIVEKRQNSPAFIRIKYFVTGRKFCHSFTHTHSTYSEPLKRILSQLLVEIVFHKYIIGLSQNGPWFQALCLLIASFILKLSSMNIQIPFIRSLSTSYGFLDLFCLSFMTLGAYFKVNVRKEKSVINE